MGFTSLLPYYTAFLDFVAKISWPVLIFVIALMFRGKLGTIVEAISERVADLVELKIPGASVSFGGRVALDEGQDKLVLPSPKSPDPSYEVDGSAVTELEGAPRRPPAD